MNSINVRYWIAIYMVSIIIGDLITFYRNKKNKKMFPRKIAVDLNPVRLGYRLYLNIYFIYFGTLIT